MTGKGNSERLVFGAAVLVLCWFFPNPPVLFFSLTAIIGLVFSALPGTAADIEAAEIEAGGRSKIMAKIAGFAVLFAFAGFGIWRFPHPLMIIVGGTVLATGVGTLVACLVTLLFAGDRRAGRRSKPAER